MEQIRLAVLVMELGILAVQDMKRKSLSLWLLIGMLAFAGIARCVEMLLWNMEVDHDYFLVGCAFGVGLTLLAHFTRLLGTGDGMTVLLIALMSQGILTIGSFMLAMTTAAMTGGVLLALGKVKRTYEMPFVPYLFLSAVVSMMGGS